MKTFGRAIQLNCLFLVVVALLVALQLFLQQAQERLQVGKREAAGKDGLKGSSLARPLQDAPDDALQDNPGLGQEAADGAPDDSLAAEPFVPNIRKSFSKRKAPYIRKGKKNKKKALKNKKNRQQKRGSHGGLKEGDGKFGNPKTTGGAKGGMKAAGKLATWKNGEKSAQNKHSKKKGSNGNEKNIFKTVGTW